MRSAAFPVSWESTDRILNVDPCGTIVDWVRQCYAFTARLTPGGPLFQGRFYFADPNAMEFPHAHKWFCWSQWRQAHNDAANASNVGELTKGAGLLYQQMTPPRRRGNVQRRLKEQWRRGDRPENSLGTEWHGTPNAFLGLPELDGRYFARTWLPEEITPEEFAALPECIREKWADHFPDPCWLLADDVSPILAGPGEYFRTCPPEDDSPCWLLADDVSPILAGPGEYFRTCPPEDDSPCWLLADDVSPILAGPGEYFRTCPPEDDSPCWLLADDVSPILAGPGEYFRTCPPTDPPWLLADEVSPILADDHSYFPTAP